MPHAITVDELTPEWLTEVLQRAQVLVAGEVVAIEKQPTSAFNSHTLHLKVAYTGTQSTNVPDRFLLKCNIPADWGKRAGAREVAFYEMMQASPDLPPVIAPCYDAVYEAASGNSHLLLADLSASHVVAVERDKQIAMGNSLPTAIHLEQAVEAFARFHAYWWQNPHLGTGVAQIGAWCSDEEHFAATTAKCRRIWNDLIAHEQEWFPPQLVTFYEKLLDEYPFLWRRYTQPRLATFTHLTLTHGDAYLANILCPRPGQPGNAYIIDWQSPEVYRGASDLANMCATFWTHEQRVEGDLELNVLRHYLRILHENGVRGYAWEDLVVDYQLALVDWLFVPLQDRVEGSSKSYWWPKMQCLVAAFEDWRVAELFE